jgi:hypothetical protein
VRGPRLSWGLRVRSGSRGRRLLSTSEKDQARVCRCRLQRSEGVHARPAHPRCFEALGSVRCADQVLCGFSGSAGGTVPGCWSAVRDSVPVYCLVVGRVGLEPTTQGL